MMLNSTAARRHQQHRESRPHSQRSAACDPALTLRNVANQLRSLRADLDRLPLDDELAGALLPVRRDLAAAVERLARVARVLYPVASGDSDPIT
jgi:hypothetical protein